MSSIFTETKRFRQAVQLINGVAPRRFPLLVGRIASQLGEQSAAFTADEEAKLRTVLGLNEDQLTTVLEASSYIFEQAAYFSCSFKKLGRQLLAAQMAEAQAQAFSQAWQENAESYLTQLKAHSLGGPKVLDQVSWRLHLTLENQQKAQLTDLTSILHFTTSNTDGSDAEDLTLQFTQEQLTELFGNLQEVQSQLDALT